MRLFWYRNLAAQLGPMLVKYLQKRLAISPGLEMSRESQCPEYLQVNALGE